MTRAELESLLVPVLNGLPDEVVAVYLFGSWARGTARERSDVDLAFWRSERSAPTLEAQPYLLESRLEGALAREVDFIELNRAPPDLIHEVLRDGRILLDRDAPFRVRCEVSARATYLDLRPVLRAYRAPRAAR